MVRLVQQHLSLLTGKALLSRDEASAAGEGEIGPYPGGKYRDTVAKSDQEKDVDDKPSDPCIKPRR